MPAMERNLRGGPEIGLHHGIPYAVYSAWPGERFSDLKHFEHTSAHARLRELKPDDEKLHFTQGRVFHVAGLEPELLERQFATVPKVVVDGVLTGDKRLKPVMRAWEDLKRERPDAEILKEDEFNEALSWRDSIWAHPLMGEILGSPGFNEASVFWQDPATGLFCKARVDAMRIWKGYTIVIDLKSQVDGSPWGMTQACAKYHYPAQAAHYLNGLNAIAPGERRFMWFTVEKKVALPAIYEPDFATLEYGKRQIAGWLATLAECHKTGEWPGYPAGINPVSLPEWKFRQEEYDDDL
jgi:exodeoxyribonuclease VIII